MLFLFIMILFGVFLPVNETRGKLDTVSDHNDALCSHFQSHCSNDRLVQQATFLIFVAGNTKSVLETDSILN